MSRLLPTILLIISFLLFFLTIQATYKKIGTTHPGYLAFQNGVVGAFYLPSWSGPEQGISYHDQIEPQSETNEIFSLKDFVLIVIFPAISGILFVILGTALSLYLPYGPGRFVLMLFHFFAGNYLILSPDFHLTYQFSSLLLFFFCFIPAFMVHFALVFPEESTPVSKHKILCILPYILSGFLFVPYWYFFISNPTLWITIEYLIVFYVIGAYLFWIGHLLQTLKKPHLEFNRIIARYLLVGQIIAFVVPLAAAVAIFIGGIPFPLNLATPLTLLFPISLFIGVILGRLRQSQMQLIQSEKRAAFGNLLAGLAHEINNPMTFIYSSIEPLRESHNKLKNVITDKKAAETLSDAEQLVDAMEEGAIRAKDIIENFRNFSSHGQKEMEPVDINEILKQSLSLLTPRWKDRIIITKKLGEIPIVLSRKTEIGQVFVNILANACDAISKSGVIEVITKKGDSKIVVSIKDNGYGISKDRLPKIFDPFYTTKKQGEGTGLGLAITLEIIKQHGGTIDVKSELGKGTEFIVTLPVGGANAP